MDKLIDPNGNATTWERDVQARVTKETRANGSFKTYTYETTTSRLKKTTDAKLQEIQYSYGLDDKLLATTYVNAQNPTPNVAFSYIDPATSLSDAHGRLRSMTDGTGVTTYAYLPFTGLGAGQLQSVDGPYTNDTIAYGYDELGRVVSRTMNSVTSTWAYDQQGRLTTLGDPTGNFTYAYVANTGRVQSVSYPNGQTSTYAYLPVAQDLRLQTIHHKKPDASTLNKFDYTYDALGNIKTWSQQTDANPAQVYDYEYDRADQLEFATLKSTGGAVLKRYRYDYDPAGNRAIEQIDEAATISSFDNMNRLTSQTPGGSLVFRGSLNEPASVTVATKPATVTATNQFTGSAAVSSGPTSVAVKATDPAGNIRTNTYQVSQTGATKTFSYDPNGNMTADGVKTYEWSAENRLIAVKQGAATLASFTYDGRGRRATKTAGGITISYVHDLADLLEERQSGTLLRRYVHGRGLDTSLARIAGGGTSYLVADHLGSIVRLCDAFGQPSSTASYDPYGNEPSGGPLSGYGFTGREWDVETGLYYYRARYYSPALGRFLQQESTRASLLSLYTYVGNSPIRYNDPSGHVEVDTSGVRVYAVPNVQQAAHLKHPTVGFTQVEFGVDWDCQCIAGGEAYSARFLIVARGTILYDPTRKWPYAWGQPLDPSVVDPATALAHEWHYHVDLPIQLGVAFLRPWESETYSGLALCDQNSEVAAKRAAELMAAVGNAGP